MSETQNHVNKLRHAYQLWNDTLGGSVQTWLGLFTDDIVIRSLGDENPRLEFAKSRQGKSGAEQYFAELGSSWEMVYFTPEEFIAQDDRVVVLSKVAFKSRITGKTAQSPKADIFRFRDGKIVEFLEFFDTAAAQAATHAD
jgi:ketosteroid isomerase-like protein